MTTEVILHLTDLHFGYDDDATAVAERKLALTSLINKVLMLPRAWKPTVVCITGPEPTHPPLPLSFRIHQDVVVVVAEFVMAIWAADETKWPDERAVDLTCWAVAELLPSPPRNMWISGQRLSSFVSDTAFTAALFQSVKIKEPSRGNLALRTFADALGLTQDEYTRDVTEVINAI